MLIVNLLSSVQASKLYLLSICFVSALGCSPAVTSRSLSPPKVQKTDIKVEATAKRLLISSRPSYYVSSELGLQVGANEGVLGSALIGKPAQKKVLRLLLVEAPSHGNLILNSSGSFKYLPKNNYEGEDYFIYKAFDGALHSANIKTKLIVRSSFISPDLKSIDPKCSMQSCQTDKNISVGKVKFGLPKRWNLKVNIDKKVFLIQPPTRSDTYYLFLSDKSDPQYALADAFSKIDWLRPQIRRKVSLKEKYPRWDSITKFEYLIHSNKTIYETIVCTRNNKSIVLIHKYPYAEILNKNLREIESYILQELRLL